MNLESLIHDAYQEHLGRKPNSLEVEHWIKNITEGNPQAEILIKRIQDMRERVKNSKMGQIAQAIGA